MKLSMEHEEVHQIFENWIQELREIYEYVVYSNEGLILIGPSPEHPKRHMIDGISVRYRYDKRHKCVEFQGAIYDDEGLISGNPNRKDICHTREKIIKKLLSVTKRAFIKFDQDMEN